MAWEQNSADSQNECLICRELPRNGESCMETKQNIPTVHQEKTNFKTLPSPEKPRSQQWQVNPFSSPTLLHTPRLPPWSNTAGNLGRDVCVCRGQGSMQNEKQSREADYAHLSYCRTSYLHQARALGGIGSERREATEGSVNSGKGSALFW